MLNLISQKPGAYLRICPTQPSKYGWCNFCHVDLQQVSLLILHCKLSLLIYVFVLRMQPGGISR